MITAFTEVLKQTSGLFLPAGSDEPSRPIWMLSSAQSMENLSPEARAWLSAIDFRPRAGNWAMLPARDGVAGAVLNLSDKPGGSPLALGTLAAALPPGDYHLATAPSDPELAALAWALGAYTFGGYQSAEPRGPRRLKAPAGVAVEEVARRAAAVWLGRNLVNTPANDLGPAELEAAVRDVAGLFDAELAVTVGDDLLAANFPLIHAVGRASPRAPRLMDLSWGSAGPLVTLVGKGICFDTGGLNLKPGAAMALMKKDMGGAAAALSCAVMIMSAALPVRLRLLIPAAENSISGASFRPGDIIASRAGMTVEIGDTDAEGRLVLADALALADADSPDYLISFATLTGSARVALGPDLPPLYATDEALGAELAATGLRIGDPCWPMPFWQPYDALIESKFADFNSIHPEPIAGSIIAALFLRRFVKAAKRFIHLDIFGWVPRPQPGKPFGGEPQCARAVYDLIKAQVQHQ